MFINFICFSRIDFVVAVDFNLKLKFRVLSLKLSFNFEFIVQLTFIQVCFTFYSLLGKINFCHHITNKHRILDFYVYDLFLVSNLLISQFYLTLRSIHFYENEL
jgi:hypothetical protein